MPGSNCTITRRNVVTDSSGGLWDLANPDIISISSVSSGAQTQITLASGSAETINVDFATASAAFNAS